jgi:hypothetical protein
MLADEIGLRETFAIMGVIVIVAMAVYLAVGRRTTRRIGAADLV